MPRYTFLKYIVFRSIFRGFLRGLSPQNPEGIAPRERSSHPALYLADALHQLALRLTGIGAEPDLDPGGIQLAPVAFIDRELVFVEKLLFWIIRPSNSFIGSFLQPSFGEPRTLRRFKCLEIHKPRLARIDPQREIVDARLHAVAKREFVRSANDSVGPDRQRASRQGLPTSCIQTSPACRPVQGRAVRACACRPRRDWDRTTPP